LGIECWGASYPGCALDKSTIRGNSQIRLKLTEPNATITNNNISSSAIMLPPTILFENNTIKDSNVSGYVGYYGNVSNNLFQNITLPATLNLATGATNTTLRTVNCGAGHIEVYSAAANYKIYDSHCGIAIYGTNITVDGIYANGSGGAVVSNSGAGGSTIKNGNITATSNNLAIDSGSNNNFINLTIRGTNQSSCVVIGNNNNFINNSFYCSNNKYIVINSSYGASFSPLTYGGNNFNSTVAMVSSDLGTGYSSIQAPYRGYARTSPSGGSAKEVRSGRIAFILPG
jgi:hypothetical protein